MSPHLLTGVSSAPAPTSLHAGRAAEAADAPAPFAQALNNARKAGPRKADVKDAKGSAKAPEPTPAKADPSESDAGRDKTQAAGSAQPAADALPVPPPNAVAVAAAASAAPVTADALLQAALAASSGATRAHPTTATGIGTAAEAAADTASFGESSTDTALQAVMPGAAPRAGDAAHGHPKAHGAAPYEPMGAAAQAAPAAPAQGEGEDLKALWQAQMGREAGPAALAPGASTPQAAASAAAALAQASPAQATEQWAQAPIGPLVGHPEFAPALGSQLTTFVREGIRQAELSLNPAEMGPVTVNIALDGQQAQVDFVAAHAATRVALEQSLPALASALHQAGFTLSGGGVSDQRPRGQRSANQEEARAARDRLESVGSAGARTGAAARRGQGLLDLFA